MGSSSNVNMAAELDKLKEEVRSSTEQERWLDGAIAQMQSSLRELADDDTNAQYAYVTHEDVRNIPAFAPDTVIAIKAPSGTTLEVPDPDEGMEYPQRRYQIYLKSQSGPVEVFLVSTADGEGEEGASSASAAGAIEAADAESRRSSKRARDGALVDDTPMTASLGRASDSSMMMHSGLLELNPVDAVSADYWNAAPTSHELGVADLFFVDSDVKVEG